MASKNPPIKNQAWETIISLRDPVSGDILTAPTLAAGDFKISGDYAALGNPGTLPAVSPASSGAVKMVFTAGEMNFDVVYIRWIDQTNPKEWADGYLAVLTVS
jgi:hypothetical protein